MFYLSIYKLYIPCCHGWSSSIGKCPDVVVHDGAAVVGSSMGQQGGVLCILAVGAGLYVGPVDDDVAVPELHGTMIFGEFLRPIFSVWLSKMDIFSWKFYDELKWLNIMFLVDNQV